MTIEQINALNQNNFPQSRLFALSLTRDEDRMRDLLQEVSYKILKSRNSFQPGTNFPAWVKRIIRNTFISDFRQTKRRARIISQNRVPSGWHRESTVLNTGVSALEEEAVKALIDKLPRIYRQTFLLYFQGMSYQNIAIRSRVPVGTIKSRLFTARTLLKKKLRQRGISASAKK
jgi:RNA polymerase sigma-70 factor (ECF subfamily)